MDKVLVGPPGYQSEFVGAFRFVLRIFANWVYAMFIFSSYGRERLRWRGGYLAMTKGTYRWFGQRPGEAVF